MGSIYTQDMNSPPPPTPSYSSSSTSSPSTSSSSSSSPIILPIPSFWFQISKHHQSLALICYHPVQWAEGRVLENWIKEVEGAFRCRAEPFSQLSEKCSRAEQCGVWDLCSFCGTSKPASRRSEILRMWWQMWEEQVSQQPHSHTTHNHTNTHNHTFMGGAGVSTTTHNLFYFTFVMGHTSVLTCLLGVLYFDFG